MNELPPELKAMQTMMDMVFGAIAAPRADTNAGGSPGRTASRSGTEPAGAAPQTQETWQEANERWKQEAAPRRMDIETAIMRAPGFDYLTASEIFAALQRRLELRYENLNPQVEEAMQRLSRAFEQAS